MEQSYPHRASSLSAPYEEGSPTLIVGIADIKVGTAPQVIKTTLGSCVAVCLYNSDKKVGGMLHFMLARVLESETQLEVIKKAKYADTGIPELLRQLRVKYQLESGDFTARIFGGASLLPGVTKNIGKENDDAARAVLRQNGVRVTGAKIGGTKGYKIDFDLADGTIKVQLFGEAPEVFR